MIRAIRSLFFNRSGILELSSRPYAMPKKKKRVTKSVVTLDEQRTTSLLNPYSATIPPSSNGLLSSIFGDEKPLQSGGLFSSSGARKLKRLTQNRVQKNERALAAAALKQQQLFKVLLSSEDILKARRITSASGRSQNIIASITVDVPEIEADDNERSSSVGELRLFAGECTAIFRQQGVLLLRSKINGTNQNSDGRVAEEEDVPGSLFPEKLLQALCTKAKIIEQEVCERLDRVGSQWRVSLNDDTRDIHNLDLEQKHSFRYYEVASRCLGRLDVRRGMEMKPYNDKNVIMNPYFMSIVTNLLGIDAKLVYAGLIFSFVNSADQPWHQDGPKLFNESEFPSGTAIDLPPYALNIFIPLQDVTEDLGPTEFLVQSHLLSKAKELNQHLTAGTDVVNDNVSMQLIGPTLKCGDALFYDYRVCHRGTRNLSCRKETRPMLYLMYARPWFHEHLNFGKERLFADGSGSCNDDV